MEGYNLSLTGAFHLQKIIATSNARHIVYFLFTTTDYCLYDLFNNHRKASSGLSSQVDGGKPSPFDLVAVDDLLCCFD